MIGSIFLWMFWPSFNGALAEGATQHRVFCNTLFGICGSVIGASVISRNLFGKLDMEIVLNATLAGGVAIGTCCDLVAKPFAAMLIGTFGGMFSAVGFAKIGPALAKSINL